LIKKSVYGDRHPQYSGSVVKALASAKYGVQDLITTLQEAPPLGCDITYVLDQLSAQVHDIFIHSKQIYEFVIRSPLASRHFKPGQFYKLQTYEKISTDKGLTEPLAMTGAWADPENDLISVIALVVGESTRRLTTLKVGDPVVLMGPCGEPTDIPHHQNILLIGGGLGNAVLFSIGKEAIKRGNTVTYVAGYKNHHDIFKKDMIEQSAQKIVWCLETEPSPSSSFESRIGDHLIQGTVLDGLDRLSPELPTIDWIMAIGSDRMMGAVAHYRFHAHKHLFEKSPVLMGSINSPMNCMMKGICGQCLQKKHLPDGTQTYIFTCQNQDQSLEDINFSCLHQRLSQNDLNEKLAKESV